MATFSISAVARKAQATANGSTTEFSFSFSVNTEADVAVFVGTTLKTISTHYTVSITSSTGAGSITFTSGNTPTNGQIVTIMSKTALARSSVYTSGGTINATSLETDFDTNMMLFQQQDERLDRAMTAPVDDVPSIDMTLPSKSVRASHLLGFDSNGEPSVTGLVTSTNIADNAIGTNKILDNTVTTAKIDDAQITLAKMAENSVDSAQYVDGSIDTAHIADAQITVAKMAANSIDSAQYVDGSIDTAHIADAQITTAKINADAVTNAKLADNSVDSEQYVDGSIDTAHIADLNVTQAKIAGEAINESKLQVSNAPQNGYVLTAQSGNTGGLTWSAASESGLSSLVADGSPQLGGALDVNGQDIVSTSNGAIELDPHGSGKVTFKGNSTRGAGQLVLNCEQNSHGITVKGPPHSAGASYTLTLPNTDGSANEVLKTDGSGNLDWVAQTTDTNTTYSVGDGGLTQNNFTNTLKSKLDGIAASATADQTDAEIRTAVEAASDSNVFTDADHTKLNGIAASANNYVHPNHSGEVTSTADGATVIADNIVDEANLKVSNSPTNGYFLSAQSGNTGGLTWAAASGGGGGGTEFIASSGVISNAASVAFTQFDASKYDNYLFYFMYVKPASDNVNFYGQASTDGGSNYDSTNGNYHVNGTTDAPAFHLNRSAGPGNNTNEYGVCGTMTLFGPHLSNYTYANPNVILQGYDGQIFFGNKDDNAATVHLVAADVDAIKFTFSSGNIASGEIIMFGVVNS